MPTTMNHGSRVDDDAEPGDAGAAPRLIGTRIGKYQVVRMVGKGGMGCVYEAVNTSIQKRVAMKCIDHELAKNDEAYERFHREALAASAIESPHIVQIFDAGKMDDGVPFIVMELLRGLDLGQHLARVGRLELNDALHITIQVLKGLHHAHTAGIVHRDLKPDNVFLVDRDEDPVFVKLLDFGVSKISRATDVPLQTLTRQGTVVGTPFYMSPEQAQAFPDVDARTDVYSCGAMLFECLAGRPPHAGKSYEQVIVNICMKDADDVRTHNPSIPGGVAAVIAKALSREREDRYETARAMLDALVDGAPESFRRAAPSSKLRGVSLGTANGGPHTPLVISPAPGLHVPSGLADTINIDEDTAADPRLHESGVSPKSERAGTLPSDPADAQPDDRILQAQSVSAPLLGATPRRRWALAAAPGIALLLGLALYLSFGRTSDAESPTNLASPTEELPSEDTPRAPPKIGSDAVKTQTGDAKRDALATAPDAAPSASARAHSTEQIKPDPELEVDAPRVVPPKPDKKKPPPNPVQAPLPIPNGEPKPPPVTAPKPPPIEPQLELQPG